MTTDIVVSAPGKVILHGEHSVVYGKVAVASSLNLRCFVHAAISKDGDVTLDLPDVNICRKWSVASLENNLLPRLELCHDSHGHPSPPTEKSLHRLKQFAEIDTEESESRHLAIISFLYLYCYIGQRSKEQSGLPPIHVRMISQLPVGAGLGSSAAFSVCLAAVLLQLTGQATPSVHPEEQGDSNSAKGAVWKWSLDDLLLINKWAFLGEKIIHGHPSGIDNSVSTLGGAIRFQNKQITTVEKMPSIKILLTNTNVPRSTKTLVAYVKNKHDKFPEVMGPVLQAMEGLAERSIKVYGHMFDRPDKWQGYSQLEVSFSF
ncbi:hypothetical protein V1264_021286 [Littorina saxatilis]|uniref:Mevalonate kinase n=1 Tax=Littorina saxatilis TaxID=31220 RepID=A0AAN9AI25_9CAEN